MDGSSPRKVLRGVPVSSGIAIGPAYLFHPQKREISRHPVAPENAEQEVARLKRALERARKDIQGIRDRIAGAVGEYEARIFDSHVLILRDEEIMGTIYRDIRENLDNAEYAFYRRMNQISDRFDQAAGGFLKEHLIDLRDVASRVIDILTLSDGSKDAPEIHHPVVLLARTVTPSELAQFTSGNTLGICLETGGKTSHVAILARSLEIPAVSGIPWKELSLEPGQMVIVDGNAGQVILNPSLRDIKEHEGRRAAHWAHEQDLAGLRDMEPVTSDGKYISLAANVELPVEVESVLRHGADGVGLYRSEFLFLGREDMPSEEEQYQAYRHLAEHLAPRHVTIRTLDAGGDKPVPALQVDDERDPMGWRSIRVSLRNPAIFKVQLRAILRASASGNVRLMFPMISNLQEFREAKRLTEQAREELRAQGLPFDENLEIGCMIEVPSAVLMAKEIAREADFFSIGTNDLAQFTLAVDRSNERVSDLYEPHSPAVLREIQMVVEAARSQGIPVGVCGEMAADPYLALLFIGMGVDELSMSPGGLLEMKRMTRAIRYEDARLSAREALRLGTATEIHQWLEDKFRDLFVRLGLRRGTGAG